jgi:hypothetical protein
MSEDSPILRAGITIVPRGILKTSIPASNRKIFFSRGPKYFDLPTSWIF